MRALTILTLALLLVGCGKDSGHKPTAKATDKGTQAERPTKKQALTSCADLVMRADNSYWDCINSVQYHVISGTYKQETNYAKFR